MLLDAPCRHVLPLCIVALVFSALPGCDNQETAQAPVGPGVGGAEADIELDASLPDLPASFIDHVPRVFLSSRIDDDGNREEFRHELDPVPFEMVLIPGDTERGIEPFYMGKTEVTWEMFQDWAYCRDLSNADASELVQQDLRPTPLYGDTEAIHMGLGQRPAIGMSWRTAQAFCLWLSEQTGRTYRLPTDEEWLYALEKSGGIPGEREALLAQAIVIENAPLKEDMWMEATTPVANREPNALGLYDLLGNAAEWVQPTDEGAWVRGGHFLLPADELVAEWRSVEDQHVWNATYPNMPFSRFWYKDHYYQGLRLVCEPVNLPEPTGEVMPPREHVSGVVQYAEPPPGAGQRLRPEPMGIEREITEMPVRFNMVLIPGDEENGIAPFYLQTTEVTWAMFGNWFAGHGLDDAAYEKWLSYDLHPSEYWDSDMVKMGLGARPAVGMSRRSAELYCDWLSEQAGHTYRLPTDAEWSHALEVSGGVPLGTVSLLRRATLRDNAPRLEFDRDFPPVDLGARTTPARRRLPNRLGLYDLLGNAAEWVTDTDDQRVVRGGHFLLPADELTADWRAVEDTDVWRGEFPQTRDRTDVLRGAPFVGFRLVREVKAR